MLRFEKRPAPEGAESRPGGDWLDELLAIRGIDTPEKAEAFLHPRLEDLYDPFLLQDLAGASSQDDTGAFRGDLHDRIALIIEDRIFIIVRDRRNGSQERIAFCDMFFSSLDELRVDPHGQGGFLDDIPVIEYDSEGLGYFFPDGVPAGTVNAADRDYFHVVFLLFYFQYDR